MLYRQRLATPGHAFAPDTPWQHEMEEAFPFEETPDQLQAIDRREGRHGAADPDGPPRLRRRRLRQDRGRGAGRVQGGAGRQAGRRARADHAARRASTARRSASASPTTRCGSRCCRGSSRRRSRTRSCATSSRARSTCVIGTHRLLSDDVKFKDLGLLVVDEEQRFGVQHKERIKQLRDQRRRAHAHRHADPAHARAVAHRHPRPVAREHAARGPPADPHLRRRVRRPRRRRGDPARAAARGPGVLRAQPRAATSSSSPRTCARSCPRRASRSRTGRWTRAGSSGSCSTSRSASTTCSCARRSSRAASTCRR